MVSLTATIAGTVVDVALNERDVRCQASCPSFSCRDGCLQPRDSSVLRRCNVSRIADVGRLGSRPNGLVGVAWLDLTKEHYGIHGTPEPQFIGKTQSHGCLRMTNWDVMRLSRMMKPGFQAKFVA